MLLLKPLLDLNAPFEKHFFGGSRRSRWPTMFRLADKSGEYFFLWPGISRSKTQSEGNCLKPADRFSVKAGCPRDGADAIPGQPTTKNFLTIHDSNLPVWHVTCFEQDMSHPLFESTGVGERARESGGGTAVGIAARSGGQI